MRLHRFIGDFDLGAGRVTSPDAALAHQLGNVFRLRAGDGVILCDGRGMEAVSSIMEIAKNRVEFQVSEAPRKCPIPLRQVTLHAALLRRENFELVVQKAVECGAARIVPLLTRRTVKQTLRIDRLEKIAKEAAEQSGRGIVPEIAAPVSFENALKDLKDAPSGVQKIFCDFDGKPLLRMLGASGADVAVFVGPEGGWDDDERSVAQANGCEVADMGPLTLRGETAAIAAVWAATNSGK